MRFSILIPVYNVEKYIETSVDSVMKQTYQDYEVILYDDNSTDSSGAICDKYKAKYPEKLRVVHGDSNIGLCLGRIELVKYARGEYCIFVDSDDFVSADLLTTVDEAIREFSPDIVMYDMFAHYETRLGIRYNREFHFDNKKRLYKEEDLEDYYRSLATFQIHAAWRRAFRREVWERIEFDGLRKEVQIGEDIYFALNLLEHTRSIAYIPEALYYYRCNFSSMTHVFRVNRIFDKLRVSEFFLNSIEKNGMKSKEIVNSIFKYVSDSVVQYITTMASRSCRLSREDREKIYLKLSDELLIEKLIRKYADQTASSNKSIIEGIYSKDFSQPEKLIKKKKAYYFFRDTCGKVLLK